MASIDDAIAAAKGQLGGLSPAPSPSPVSLLGKATKKRLPVLAVPPPQGDPSSLSGMSPSMLARLVSQGPNAMGAPGMGLALSPPTATPTTVISISAGKGRKGK